MQSPKQQSNRPKKRVLGNLLITAFLFLLGFALLSNRQYIADSISYAQYKPTTDIENIASTANFTSDGKFLLYASQPSVEGSASFNNHCDRKEQSAAILGCYVNNKIYIYDVTDERLDGIKEVTAAHEMLHAVYQRLSDTDRQRINALLETEYEQLKNDPNYTERLAYYARTEPGERDNELHSIIGTEVAVVNGELEAYYKKYFENRAAITSLYAKYNSVFKELSSRADELSKQLDQLSNEIKRASAEYNNTIVELNTDITAFNARANGGQFASQAQFNAERAGLINRSGALSVQRSEINALIAKFNSLRDEYNSTVMQSNELYQSIDSNLKTAPKI